MTWQFVILRDSDDRVHLGALVAGTPSTPAEYFDLLAPVGVRHPDAGNPCRTTGEVVIVGDEQLAERRWLLPDAGSGEGNQRSADHARK